MCVVALLLLYINIIYIYTPNLTKLKHTHPSKVYASNSGSHWTQSGWGLLQRQRAGEGRDGLPRMIWRHAAGLPSSHAVPETMKTSPPADTSAVRKHPYSYNHLPPSNIDTKSSTCNIARDICPIPQWDLKKAM